MNEAIAELINKGFLASLAASIGWDAIKAGAKAFFKAHPDEEKTWVALCSSLERFYEVNGWDYDESVILPSFTDALSRYKDLRWHMRDVLEYATGERLLSDRQFKQWVELFKAERSKTCVDLTDKDLPFSDRETTLIEIRNKVLDQVAGDDSYGDFNEIIQKVSNRFNESWKTSILEVIDSREYDESLSDRVQSIHSDIQCEHIVREIKYLYDKVKWSKPEEDILKSFLEFPRFDKVLLISGTSGSGKSNFIREYSKYVVEGYLSETTVPCTVAVQKISSLLEDVYLSIRHFTGIELSTLSEYRDLLDALHIRVCFVIEDINRIINDKEDWKKITEEIRELSKYEQFRFIITINEYEYYQVESDQDFLNHYCINPWDNDSPQIQNSNVLSIDKVNEEKGVVSAILSDGFGITGHIDLLTTPLEAKYYGECVADDRNAGKRRVSPPTSYFEFIKKIYRWKQEQLKRAGNTDPKPILNEITNQRNSIVSTELDVKPFRDVQLLSVEQGAQSVFDNAAYYNLRIYPYWAVGIVGIDSDHLQDYPDEMKEWLLSCFVFREIEKEAKGGRPSYRDVFRWLYEHELLDYALFLSDRGSGQYNKELFNFLIEDVKSIPNDRLCFAILRFVQNDVLSIEERFKLCVFSADAVCEHDLIEVYKRAFDGILRDVHSPEELIAGMRELAGCTNNTINHINGYAVGQKLIEKSDGTTIADFTQNTIQLLLSEPRLQRLIESGGNRNFFDFFVRKNYEFYIGQNRQGLESLFNRLSPFFKSHKPIGALIKRNFTCAAGNLFEKRENKKFQRDYINTVSRFSKARDSASKETAWFMISNSVGGDNGDLNRELKEVLEGLAEDSSLRKYSRQMRSLLTGDRKSE